MFKEKVWDLCKKVPKGKVSTYKSIAEKLIENENKNIYLYCRAVGNALNKSPGMPLVPCHRIIGSSGKLIGFAKGLKAKKKLLKSESVEIKDNRINLKKYLFKFN